MIGNLAASFYHSPAESLPELQETLLLRLRHADPDPAKWIFTQQDTQQSCRLHKLNRISDAELVGIFLLSNNQREHRNLWLGGSSKIDPKSSIFSQISRIRLRAVKEQALVALAMWAKSEIQAKACFGKVRVSELVQAQSEGWRYVGIADSTEFIAHDLCHLFRYFFANMSRLNLDEYHQGQRGFFLLADGILPMLSERGWVVDADYEDKAPLNHIVTDMNGDGIFLHAALLAKLMELMRLEKNSDGDLLPEAMNLIWSQYPKKDALLEAMSASNPIIASRRVESILIEMASAGCGNQQRRNCNVYLTPEPSLSKVANPVARRSEERS
jgi:hypothetical protein